MRADDRQDDEVTVSVDRVTDDLAAAWERLARLTDLIADAAASPRRTEGRIADRTGLLAFADAEVLEQDGRGLRPWLDDLAAAASAGRDTDVAYGLAAWRELAAMTEQAARTVIATNGAPLEHRRELRGRLESVHEKAARFGLAEDEELSAHYARAFEVLFRAPTDLADGERLTMSYLRAVNERIGGAGGRPAHRATPGGGPA